MGILGIINSRNEDEPAVSNPKAERRRMTRLISWLNGEFSNLE